MAPTIHLWEYCWVKRVVVDDDAVVDVASPDRILPWRHIHRWWWVSRTSW